MPRLSFALFPLFLVAPLAAQTPDQPNLTLTLFAGAVTGHSLWNVPRQPLCVLTGGPPNFSCDPTSDTLRLTREVSSSIVAGASATYFRGPHVGLQGEIYYLGLPFQDSCSPLGPYQTDSDNKNQQLCDNISSATPSIGAIAVFAGVIVRASGMHAISPYVRAGGGVVLYSGGTKQVSGNFQQGGNIYSRAVIEDDHPKTTSVSLQVGTGMTARVGPGYQFRFELRDAIVPLQRVTGPADQLGIAPATTRLYHHFALTLGLDVVLERKRGRRY
jgi:hypothetical protein